MNAKKTSKKTTKKTVKKTVAKKTAVKKRASNKEKVYTIEELDRIVDDMIAAEQEPKHEHKPGLFARLFRFLK
jgi:hypothetical protein